MTSSNNSVAALVVILVLLAIPVMYPNITKPVEFANCKFQITMPIIDTTDVPFHGRQIKEVGVQLTIELINS
jgi:hypothetical protein